MKSTDPPAFLAMPTQIDKAAMQSLMADAIDGLIEDKQKGRLSKRTRRLLRELLEAEAEIETAVEQER